MFTIETCQAASMIHKFYSPNIVASGSSRVGEDALSVSVERCTRMKEMLSVLIGPMKMRLSSTVLCCTCLSPCLLSCPGSSVGRALA